MITERGTSSSESDLHNNSGNQYARDVQKNNLTGVSDTLYTTLWNNCICFFGVANMNNCSFFKFETVFMVTICHSEIVIQL